MAPPRPARSPAPGGSRAPRPTRRPGRRSLLWRLRRPLFLLGLLLLAGLAGVGFVVARLPLPAAAAQAHTTFLYDAQGGVLAELHAGEDRVAVTLDQVAPVLVDAVLAGEDDDFFSHSGIDLSAIARATWADLRSGRVAQGGSTITQQYVKAAYLSRERTLARKLREAVLAVKLERRLSKPEILERYLNAIYFGRAAYGVQAAAQAYFAKDADQLELREAAYLAGLIRAPEAAEPERHPHVADQRRDLVLAAMVDEGRATPAQAAAARAEPVHAYARPRAVHPGGEVVAADVGTPYFVDYVRDQLLRRFGGDVVYGGGLRVHTTLDLEMQRAAHQAVYGTLDRPDDPAGALVALDASGHVKAMVGGRDHAASQVNLAVGTLGGGTGRQAGSAFKPFVLAEAVEQGYSVESALPSPSRVVLPRADGGRDYRVTNYGAASHGTVNLIDATRVSSNTVYAQLITRLGADDVAELAGRMGITAPLPPVVSLTLGTAEVSPLDMADAYLTLANRGTQVPPTAVIRVTDADGRVLWQPDPDPRRVIDERTADVVTFVLQQVVRGGTGTAARVGAAVAGKTGTTQENGDAWFVGYTPRLSVAVWMGYPDSRRPMARVHGRAVTGGSFPAQIFRRFLTDVPDAYLEGSFPRPRSFPGKILGSRLRLGERPTTTTSTTTTTTTVPAPAEEAPAQEEGDEGAAQETPPTSAPPTSAPPG